VTGRLPLTFVALVKHRDPRRRRAARRGTGRQKWSDRKRKKAAPRA
jgi:hypothetical protein